MSAPLGGSDQPAARQEEAKPRSPLNGKRGDESYQHQQELPAIMRERLVRIGMTKHKPAVAPPNAMAEATIRRTPPPSMPEPVNDFETPGCVNLLRVRCDVP